MPHDSASASQSQQRGDFLKSHVYPLQDRVLRCVNNLQLPFYLTGATALNRFTLSGRYTRDLEFQVHNEPRFQEFAGHALKALGVEFAGQFQTNPAEDSEIRVLICPATDTSLEVLFRDYHGYHVDGVMPGGVFNDARCGRLDYWLNICADILARGASAGVGDAVDLWWMAKNYKFSWQEILPLAEKKAADRVNLVSQNVLNRITPEDLAEIFWIVDKDPAIVLREIRNMAGDLGRGVTNSLAPEPFDEH